MPPPPPPPAPPPPPTPPQRSRRRRRLLVAAPAVVAVAAAATIVAVTGSTPGEPDPAEALERAQDAVAGVGTFRFTWTSEDVSVAGSIDGPGSHQAFRTVADVEVAGDDMRVVVDTGESAEEYVFVEGALYARSATDVDALADEPWIVPPPGVLDAALPPRDDPVGLLLFLAELDVDGDGEVDPDVQGDRELAESLIVPALAEFYLWDGGAAAGALPVGPGLPLPAGFAGTFGRFEDAEVVHHGGGVTTIAATRRAPDIVAAEMAAMVDVALQEGRVEVDLDGDHLPTALRLSVEGATASSTETLGFADWGADVVVRVPDGEIDETPWIDEEVLAEVRGTVTALGPTDLPDGLALAGIDAIDADQAEEWGEPCGQLELWYEPPLLTGAAADAWYASPDYLSVYLLPAACARQAARTPFEPGTYGDLPSRAVYGVVEVLVGDTVVQIDTTYTAELPDMVASIEPFDLDAELARMAAAAEEWWYGGKIATEATELAT